MNFSLSSHVSFPLNLLKIIKVQGKLSTTHFQIHPLGARTPGHITHRRKKKMNEIQPREINLTKIIINNQGQL